MNDKAYLPEQPQGRSVFEARNRRSRPSRLTDGKKHPVVVRQLEEDYNKREDEAYRRFVDES